jgi:hypothetical protein
MVGIGAGTRSWGRCAAVVSIPVPRVCRVGGPENPWPTRATGGRVARIAPALRIILFDDVQYRRAGVFLQDADRKRHFLALDLLKS